MELKRFLRLVLSLLFVTGGLISCATGPSPPPGPTPESIAGLAAKTILVAPFNIVSGLPPELEDSTSMISDSLIKHLEAHGKTVHRINFSVGRQLWSESMKEVRDSGQKRNFENAAKVYARKIGEGIEFDVLIIPSLYIQNAKSRNGVARWDGAEQQMPYEGDHARNRAQVVSSRMTGTTPLRAASIFVHILNRTGHSIQTKRSGLEVIQHIQWTRTRKGGISGTDQMRWNVVNDKPPIEDIEMVRAGVAASLSPFLPIEIPASMPSVEEIESSAEEATEADPS